MQPPSGKTVQLVFLHGSGHSLQARVLRGHGQFPKHHQIFQEQEEDFATVQELRAHRRRPTKSGIVSIFSGMLYCADCGEKLYYSATNNYKREHAYFFCSSFRKDTDVCSAHFIREKVVEQLVLESLQRVFAMIQVFEKRFAQEQMAAYNKERQKELTEKRRKLNGAKKRIAEIDGLIQRIYEDTASGKLSDDRYATMSIAYENEQRALKESLSTLSEDLKREMDSSDSKIKLDVTKAAHSGHLPYGGCPGGGPC